MHIRCATEKICVMFTFVLEISGGKCYKSYTADLFVEDASIVARSFDMRERVDFASASKFEIKGATFEDFQIYGLSHGKIGYIIQRHVIINYLIRERSTVPIDIITL